MLRQVDGTPPRKPSACSLGLQIPTRSHPSKPSYKIMLYRLGYLKPGLQT